MELSVDAAALCLAGRRFSPADAVYIVSDEDDGDDDDDDDDGDDRIPSTKPPRNSAALMVNLNNPVV